MAIIRNRAFSFLGVNTTSTSTSRFLSLNTSEVDTHSFGGFVQSLKHCQSTHLQKSALPLFASPSGHSKLINKASSSNMLLSNAHLCSELSTKINTCSEVKVSWTFCKPICNTVSKQQRKLTILPSEPKQTNGQLFE